ncbi:hypothetical protein [Ilumatobacter sp.]|uniref:hypothetical protein n=1 Tax=Ilumatobacter sp. TaxID=1967498 RepID=UPI003752EED5
MGEVDHTPERGSQQQGELIVRGNVIGTAIFVATAVFAAAVFTTTAQWVGASTAMALFAVGVFAFLWGFWNAVQRSRDEEVSVTQLYMLLGNGTPKEVRRTMLLMLCIQVAVAFGTAIWRIDGPDGSPGSSLAVGLLVPMFGLGLNGLWASYHAEFGKRMDPAAVAARTQAEHDRVDSDVDVKTSTTSIDQNEAHG